MAIPHLPRCVVNAPDDAAPIMLLRYRKELGNRLRSVHCVPIDQHGPDVTALCGAVLTVGLCEQVNEGAGMPCETCVTLAYGRTTAELGS